MLIFTENPNFFLKIKVLNPSSGLSLPIYENIRVPPLGVQTLVCKHDIGNIGTYMTGC